MSTFKYLLLLLAAITSSAVAQSLPETFTHTLSNEGESYTINFSRFSSRGPLFEVAVQQSNGSFQAVDVGEPRTYIGTVNGQPGAVAACVRRSDGAIYTRMTFENGFEWIDHDGALSIQERELTPSWPTFGLRDGGAGDNLYAIDMFIDLTNRYYGTVGGTPERCMEMVDFSMTAINLIYIRDVNLINRIGRVSIRANLNNDPYSDDGSSMGSLLGSLNAEADPWVNGPNANTDHDLATVIQSLAGGGVANVGVVGNGRSANGGFTLGDFTGAARHEFGHNWGLSHFDGRGEGEPLSPEGKTINSGNGLAKMSAPEMERVLVERDDAISVLTNLGTTAPNMPPRAADDRLIIETVFPGQTFTVQPLANDNDSNGDRLSIVSVDSKSLLGATISRSGDNFRVNFPSSYPFGYDSFRYQISDESGRTSSAVVHLQTSAPKMAWEIAPTPVDGSRLYMIASDTFEAANTVEYFFEHLNGSQDSDWQTSRTFIATSLPTDQEQIYRVFARIQNTSNLSLPSDNHTATPTNLSEGILLSDNFNRGSINSNGGQSGDASPATYTLATFGTTTAGLVSNRLNIDGPAGDGSFGGLAYIDNFNFGAPLMSAFDQVSIRVDIAGYTTVGSSRQMSLAVGQSLAELQNQSGANSASSPADLVVAYRKTTNTLEIYKGGTLISAESVTGNFPSDPTEMELVYNSPSSLQGTRVTYEVYLDGRTTPHTSGTFTWSGDFQNYISLSSNLTDDALFDNLEVEIETTPGFVPTALPGLDTFTPDPNKKYYIDSLAHNLRVAADGNTVDPFTTSTTTTGSQVEWVFVAKGNGSWHIQLAAGGSKPRLRSRNNGESDMQATTSSGAWTYYDFKTGAIPGTYFATLPDHDESRSRLQVSSNGDVLFVPETLTGTWVSFRFTEVPANEDLVACWNMNETSGTNVADSSGNGFNGTMSNADHVSGFVNGGLEFNGSSSTVTIPAATFAEIDDEITIAMWVFGGTGQARRDTLFRAETASGGRVLNIHLPWDNSQVYWDAGYNGRYDRIQKAASNENFKGQWNHWTFTKNSSTGNMATYLNGTLWHSVSGKTKPMTGIATASFGSAKGTSHYQGVMDDLKIFKSSLSASEVASLYNAYQAGTAQIITQLSAPSDYDNWASSNQSVLSLGLGSDDYDSDGLSNDEERIWGLDPASRKSNSPYVKLFEQPETFQYTRRNPSLSGLVYSIWVSTDLQNWTEDLNATQRSLSDENEEVETVEVTLSDYENEQSMYFRVKAKSE